MMRLRREDPRVVGSFRLHRRLGTGGMGVVYLGSDRRGQRVALKLIRSELAEDPEFRTRFAREVSAASRIRGGCTARLVAADIAADRPWLATQYVPGPSLYDKVNDQGPLAAAEVAAIGAALAEGLIAVHEAGVVHRDLKPSNILLSPKGPRIIDFGIAWATGASTLTHVGTAVGSPGFLAPEQVRGAPVTPATDVFALGATLAYAATADSPFGHGSSEVMLYRVVHEEPDLRGVPAALSPLVAACLVKDPEERPSTASLHERLTEIHAREARGLDPAWGAPGTRGPARPGGREAAAYLRQRTEERRGGSPPTRPTAAHRPPAGSQHLPGARPGQGGQSTQGRPASGGDRPGPTARPTPGNRPGAGGGSGGRNAAGARSGPGGRPGPAGRPAAGNRRTAPDRAPRTPPPSQHRTGAGRRTGQPRPTGPRPAMLRQRLVVFVTATLLAAVGIALAQGCQGPKHDDGAERRASRGGSPVSQRPPGKNPAPDAGRTSQPRGNVAPPARAEQASKAARPLTLTRDSARTPRVDWLNRSYPDPDGGPDLRLRNGRLHGPGGDRVTLDQLLSVRQGGRPAQLVVLEREAGPVREHLVELYTFRAEEPVLTAAHTAEARPGADYRWRIVNGAVLREQRPTGDGRGPDDRADGAASRTTGFVPLVDGTFAERRAVPGS